jgi:hypothetical protein
MKFGNTSIKNGAMAWKVFISNLKRTLINSYIISIDVVDIYFYTPLKLHYGTPKTPHLHKIAEQLFALNRIG